MTFLALLGRMLLIFMAATGRIFLFSFPGLLNCVRPPIHPRLIWCQMIQIGYYALPVIGFTAVFTGMVPALQSHTGFSEFAAESAIPNVVVVSITRD